MNRSTGLSQMSQLLRRPPQAYANITGNALYPQIQGNVRFYQTSMGVLVVAELRGLPAPDARCESPIFGFHIHEGSSCSGNATDPFANAQSHYNPHGRPYPYHAGDLPPLFGANGYAFSAFLTNRFNIEEIIEKTIILHSAPDDFTTQPSGNAGMKIACGIVRK